MHAIQRKNVGVHSLVLNTSAPKDFPSIIPATAKRIIRQGVNQLITDTPVIEVSCGDTKAEQEMSGILTEVCYLLLEQWDNQNGTPPAQEIAFNLCLHGMGCKVNLYNPDCEGLEALQISVPSPVNFYSDPAGNFDLVVYDLTVGEVNAILKRFKDNFPSGDWNDIELTKQDTVKWCEYFSKDKRGYYILEGTGKNLEGYSVSRELKDNPLGFKQSYYRYSGWGITSPDGKPEDKAIGLYDGILSSLEAQARGWTAVDNHLRLNVYGRYLFDKNSGLTQKQVNEAMLPGGVALVSDPQKAVYPIPEVNINRDEWNYLTLINDDIEGMTWNRAAEGSGAVEESGLKSMTRIRQASLNMRPVRRSLELIIGQALRDAILILKNDLLFDSVKFSGKKTLDPSKIPQKVNIKVKYESVDPREDTERINLGISLLNNRAISLYDFLKDYRRVANPDIEIAQMLAEAVVFNEPNTRMALGAEALKDMQWEAANQTLKNMQQNSPNTRPEARNKKLLGSEQRMNESNMQNPVRTHAGTEYV